MLSLLLNQRRFHVDLKLCYMSLMSYLLTCQFNSLLAKVWKRDHRHSTAQMGIVYAYAGGAGACVCGRGWGLWH